MGFDDSDSRSPVYHSNRQLLTGYQLDKYGEMGSLDLRPTRGELRSTGGQTGKDSRQATVYIHGKFTS